MRPGGTRIGSHGGGLYALLDGSGGAPTETLTLGTAAARSIAPAPSPDPWRKLLPRRLLAVPPLNEQGRIVAEVDRHMSIIREVEAEVASNLQRAQALRQATLAKAFAPSDLIQYARQ